MTDPDAAYKFYREWLRIAFHHAFGLADGIGFVIGIAFPLLGRFVPSWGIGTKDLYWQIPVGVFVGDALVRLVSAPYWMHKGQCAEIRSLKEQLHADEPALFLEPTGETVASVDEVVYLNVAFRAMTRIVVVARLELRIGDLRVEPVVWSPFSAFPQRTDTWRFDLAGRVEPNKMCIGRLTATTDDGKEYQSRDFEVYP